MLGDLLDYRFFLKQRTDIRFVIIASRHPAIAMFFSSRMPVVLQASKMKAGAGAMGARFLPAMHSKIWKFKLPITPWAIVSSCSEKSS